MSNESLAHKELKRKAKEKLREMGFKDSEIFEEYPVKGHPRGYEIDIVGITPDKKVAIEVGNLDKLKKAVLEGKMGSIDVTFDEVIHMPYSEDVLQSEMYDETSEDLSERKKLLVAVYNEEVYDRLKDDTEFQFKRCTGTDDQDFKVGRFDPWMSIPTATGAWGQKLQYEVNFCMSHKKNNLFDVQIGAHTNESVKQFLGQMSLQDNKEKLLELFSKLPDQCHTQVAYKYRDSHHVAPPLPRNWEDSVPLQCNKITAEKFDEILEYLSFYLDHGASVQQYPIIRIVTCIVRREDISNIFKLYKQLYKLLFTLDTYDLRKAKKIQKIDKLRWYVGENKWGWLLDEAKDVDSNMTMEKLKKLIKLLKSKNLL